MIQRSEEGKGRETFGGVPLFCAVLMMMIPLVYRLIVMT